MRAAFLCRIARGSWVLSGKDSILVLAAEFYRNSSRKSSVLAFSTLNRSNCSVGIGMGGGVG